MQASIHLYGNDTNQYPIIKGGDIKLAHGSEWGGGGRGGEVTPHLKSHIKVITYGSLAIIIATLTGQDISFEGHRVDMEPHFNAPKVNK